MLASAAYAGFSAAPWLPTRKKVIHKILDDLKIKGNQRIYDLGCGDGTVLFEIEKKYPNSNLVGLELSLLPYFFAQLKKIFKHSKVKIQLRNLFTKDLSDANIIFVFLMMKAYKRLILKLSKELNDECLVIVEAWPVQNLQPKQIIRPEGHLPVYVYTGKMIKEFAKQYE